MGFSGGSDSKEPTCNAGDLGSIPGLERFPGGGHGTPLQYSCLENPHRQRILAGYRVWGHKELDMTEWLSTQYSVGPTNYVWILYFTPACYSFLIIHLFLFLIFFIYFIEWLVYSRILGYIHSKQKSQTLHLPVAYISLSFSAPDHPLTSTLWRGDRHHSVSTSGNGLHSQQSLFQTLLPYSHFISLRLKYISSMQPQPLAALVYSSSGIRRPRPSLLTPYYFPHSGYSRHVQTVHDS